MLGTATLPPVTKAQVSPSECASLGRSWLLPEGDEVPKDAPRTNPVRMAVIVSALLTAGATGADPGSGDTAAAEEPPRGQVHRCAACAREMRESHVALARTGLSSQVFPPRLCAAGLILLPRFSYSERNGFGIGGRLLTDFVLPGCRPGTRFSEAQLSGRVTHRGHVRGELALDLHWGVGRYVARAKVGYSDLVERFWGVGATPRGAEEAYRPRTARAYAEVMRRVRPHLYLGLRGEAQTYAYLRTEPSGLLASRRYRGSEGDPVVGGGLVAQLDRRDDAQAPTTGFYCQGFALWFDEWLGSGYDFNNYHLDLRHYFPVGRGQVLAAQVFAYEARGAPPLWRYASLGGRVHSRGYVRDRYLDRTLLAVQAEYRVQLNSRLGLAFFGGLADVAARMDALRLDTMRPTAGAGFSVRVGNRDRRIRLDLAAGEEGVRVHGSVGEAF